MQLLVGGSCDSSSGFFIAPTIFETKNPKSETMVHEIFGPVLTVEFPALTAINCSNSNIVTAMHLCHRTFMAYCSFLAVAADVLVGIRVP